MAVSEIERELQVLAVFRQLLAAPALGPEQNFFEAGGTSLLAARLAARLRSAGVLDVTTSAIFAAPTARALARYGTSAVTTSQESATDRARDAAATSGAAVDRGARQRAAFARLRPAPATEPAVDLPVEEAR